MRADGPPGSRLVAFCALDPACTAVAEALAGLEPPPGVRVRCYRVAPAGGDGESADPGAGAWECREGGEWSPLLPADGARESGLVDMMRDALLPPAPGETSFTAELVLLAAAGPDGGPVLDPTLEPSLFRVRRRYRRVTAVSLVVLARFESPTRSAAGRLVWLPGLDGAAGEVEGVDRVLLLDDVDVRGVPVNGPDESSIAARTAELIAEGTFGELAAELLRAESGNRGHLGFRGRFVSLGFARWVLRGEESRSALAEYLAARMAGAMAASPEPPPDRGDPPAGGTGWVEQAIRALWEEPPPPGEGAERRERWLGVVAAGQGERLGRAFHEARWSLHSLASSAGEQSEALRSLPNVAALRLSRFMHTFAPWYARWATGGFPAPTQPPPVVTVRLLEGRVLVFLAALVVFGGAAYGAYAAQAAAWRGAWLVVALAAAAAAVYVAIKGFHERTVFYPPIPPSPPSLFPELHRHRDANWVANQVAMQAVAQVDRLHANLRGLAGAWPSAPQPHGVPEGVHDLLLEIEGIEPGRVVPDFWADQHDPLALAAGPLDDLRAALCAYAERRCAGLEDLDWSRLAARLMAAGTPGGGALFDHLLLAIRDAAAPRIVVEGTRSGMLAALPRGLAPELRAYVRDRLGRPTLVESGDTDRLIVLRYTQGYESAAQADAPPEPPPE